MTLMINTKEFSFSPDTLTAIGGKEFCNVLIHPEEKLLLLKPSSRGQKDAINGEVCPQGILFKLKEATVDTPASIFTLFRKHRGRKTHMREKKTSFTCWNHFKMANRAEK